MMTLSFARAFVFVVVTAAALAGCGGESLDIGYDDARVDHPDTSQPVAVADIRARCDAPQSADADPYSTESAARAILSGRWFLCEPSTAAGFAVPSAIEFTADGWWFALHADDRSVFSRSSRGGGYSTWKDISCCYPDTWTLGFGAPLEEPAFYVSLRHGPREMAWAPGSSSAGQPRPTVARFIKD